MDLWDFKSRINRDKENKFFEFSIYSTQPCNRHPMMKLIDLYKLTWNVKKKWKRCKEAAWMSGHKLKLIGNNNARESANWVSGEFLTRNDKNKKYRYLKFSQHLLIIRNCNAFHLVLYLIMSISKIKSDIDMREAWFLYT